MSEGKGIKHLRMGRSFADIFLRRLLSWNKTGLTIDSRMYVGLSDHLTVFRFTRDRPFGFVQTIDQPLVTKYVQRALAISPNCEPRRGNLGVFDGKSILLFRRFGESLSGRSARQAANEVASHILMWRMRLRDEAETNPLKVDGGRE